MLKTWLVFFGLTLLWIVTRSICLETWTSDQPPAASAATDTGAQACSSCLQLIKEDGSFQASQSAEKVAIRQQRIQSCRRSCDGYFLLEQQKNKTTLISKYRP